MPSARPLHGLVQGSSHRSRDLPKRFGAAEPPCCPPGRRARPVVEQSRRAPSDGEHLGWASRSLGRLGRTGIEGCARSSGSLSAHALCMGCDCRRAGDPGGRPGAGRAALSCPWTTTGDTGRTPLAPVRPFWPEPQRPSPSLHRRASPLAFRSLPAVRARERVRVLGRLGGPRAGRHLPRPRRCARSATRPTR